MTHKRCPRPGVTVVENRMCSGSLGPTVTVLRENVSPTPAGSGRETNEELQLSKGRTRTLRRCALASRSPSLQLGRPWYLRPVAAAAERGRRIRGPWFPIRGPIRRVVGHTKSRGPGLAHGSLSLAYPAPGPSPCVCFS